MKDNLIAVAIVLTIMALVACQTAATIGRTPSTTPLRPYYATGSHTPETVLLEVDWLDVE